MGNKRFIGAVVLCLLATAASLSAQEARRAIVKRTPNYPDVARRMSLTGTVKIEITVGPDGEIKHTNVIGGHPVLVGSALDALKNWKYEPAKTETVVVVQFDFRP